MPEDPAEAMAARVFDAAVATSDVIAIALGDRLGYYRSLAGGDRTPAQLAETTGTDERCAREWLEQQAVSGFLEVTGTDTERHYRFAPGAETVLADQDSLAYLSPLARQLVSAAGHVPEVAEAFRTGHGFPWAGYGADMRESQAALNRPGFLHLLAPQWLPAMPDVLARLADGPSRVADIGCGGGWAAIALARAFPQTHVDAYDLDQASVDLARTNVAEAGLADRITVHRQDIGTVEAEPYDLVMAFECLHDLPYPVRALAAMRGLGGTVLVADMKVADEFTAPGDAVERLMYGFSVSICLPDSMSSPSSAATGTAIRRSTVEAYAREAGFDRVETLPIDHDMWRFYRLG
ncbi:MULTISPECIES: methyltransferase domain-containing protein [unclassified Amycolatopsis]|uniref:methyltransferase domain-containing protein n=1 Tax=unclassified Amycolatopsis TaxID=2618356 RepID=UPI001C6A10FF|nr:methyltransferase domain-containing protein [Amycolatopsis sp. DSM 110486]QYN20583.1 methyltransferase domain-containing protein [Amycolatopsis sp. DSM 110486]